MWREKEYVDPMNILFQETMQPQVVTHWELVWILPANNHMKVCSLPEIETPLERISTGFKGIRLM